MPDDEPVVIETARGTYRVRAANYPTLTRPWQVQVSVRLPEGHLFAGVWYPIVVCWVPTEADARRVARNLDVQVRDGVIE